MLVMAPNLLMLSAAGGWDLSTATYDSVSFSVGTEDGTPFGAAFKTDGTKLYVAGDTNNTIYQYSLSTAWDLSTASYDSVSFSVGTEDTGPSALFFKPDGTKMYVAGYSGDDVYQYSLSTAWDLSTASYDSVSFNVGGQASAPYGIAFKDDGTKMYISDNVSDAIYQYSLSTAWDLSTASYDSVSFSVGTEDTATTGIAFKDDGTKMYVAGNTNDSVYQYSLSTAWDLSTASYDSVSFSVGTQDGTPIDISFKTDGTKMYILGYSNASVFQYSLG